MITAPENREEYSGSKDRHEAWIEEAIWGHRLERQPYSALCLELLGMAEGLHRQGKLLTPTVPSNTPQYHPHRCLQLRNILFNNSRLEEILNKTRGSDDDGWKQWLEVMKETSSLGSGGSNDFSYIKQRFDSFEEFVAMVRLLRRITLDQGSERTWTLQFLFPIGPAALYEAIREKGDGFERTRGVFTRTGEIAYLMLSRCSEGTRARIRTALEKWFDPATLRNGLLLRLLKEWQQDANGEAKGGTYLPYKAHPAYERMGSDVAAILELNLPDQDAYQYLQPLVGFHVYLYAVETANAWAKDDHRIPPIVCEILAPKSDLVRKAAVKSYLDNDALGSLAVQTYVEQRTLKDTALCQRLSDERLDETARKQFLIEHVSKTFAMKQPDLEERMRDAVDVKELYQRLFNIAERFYRSGASDGIVSLGTGCGLISKRGTTRFRYAPTDELLRALVLANVRGTEEETVFLRKLHQRYRIIIGPAEAKRELQGYDFDDADFKKNRERLAQHLLGMGLAQRMSDACTYIHNPMFVET